MAEEDKRNNLLNAHTDNEEPPAEEQPQPTAEQYLAGKVLKRRWQREASVWAFAKGGGFKGGFGLALGYMAGIFLK